MNDLDDEESVKIKLIEGTPFEAMWNRFSHSQAQTRENPRNYYYFYRAHEVMTYKDDIWKTSLLLQGLVVSEKSNPPGPDPTLPLRSTPHRAVVPTASGELTVPGGQELSELEGRVNVFMHV